MGGHDRGSETLQTAWSNNRIDNPYELFIHDLLCDVTLTVSSGETSNQSGRDTIYNETETKENVAQIETSHKSLNNEKRSFKAHRLILACHSEYFHRMFISCGMREVSGEVINNGKITIFTRMMYFIINPST